MSEEKRERPKNPELVALENIDKLTRPPDDVLSDFTDIEIVTFSLYESFNDSCVEIPSVMSLIDRIRKMRGSRGRMGRHELLEAIRGSRPYIHIPGITTGTGEEDQEKDKDKSILGILMGRR